MDRFSDIAVFHGYCGILLYLQCREILLKSTNRHKSRKRKRNDEKIFDFDELQLANLTYVCIYYCIRRNSLDQHIKIGCTFNAHQHKRTHVSTHSHHHSGINMLVCTGELKIGEQHSARWLSGGAGVTSSSRGHEWVGGKWRDRWKEGTFTSTPFTSYQQHINTSTSSTWHHISTINIIFTSAHHIAISTH